MDHLTFEGGGGGVEELVSAKYFVLTGQSCRQYFGAIRTFLMAIRVA